jgi:hypothetical protein
MFRFQGQATGTVVGSWLRREFRVIQRVVVVVVDLVALIVQNGGKPVRHCMSRFRSDLLMLSLGDGGRKSMEGLSTDHVTIAAA